jgi:predicted kinase
MQAMGQGIHVLSRDTRRAFSFQSSLTVLPKTDLTMTHPIELMFPEAVATIVEQHAHARYTHSSAILVVILRGMPGSGKSMFAAFLKIWAESKSIATEIVSADSFFRTIRGYEFDVNRPQEAHWHSREHCRLAIQRSVPIIVIDNTNITQREWISYVNLARNVAAVCRVNFECPVINDAFELSDRSHANIPNDVLQRRHQDFLRDTDDFQAQFNVIPTFNSWDN